MAPEGSEEEPKAEEGLDWLDSILPTAPPASPGGDTPSTEVPSQDAGWLAGLGAEEPPATPVEVPDWLQDIQPDTPGEDHGEPVEPPDWLSSFAASSDEKPQQEADSGLEWLSADTNLPEEGSQSVIEPAAEPVDWLTVGQDMPEGESEQTEPASETPVEEAQADEETALPMVASEIPEVEVPSSEKSEPSSQAEEPTQPTGWMNLVENQAEVNEPEQTGEITPEPVTQGAGEMPADLEDTDATMAWLEALAAKQGADEATLVTSPEERSETPPDWLQEEITTQLEVPAEAQESDLPHRRSFI